MIDWIRRFFRKKEEGREQAGSKPSLPNPSVAQVEVTTRCNLKCTMCPRTHFSGDKNVDFPFEMFESFSESFSRLNHVHLQGWGEPLLHPRIFDMAALVVQNQCRVGFTTNGSLLDDRVIGEILRLPVHQVAVSVAGADDEVHGAIRVGSNLDTLLGRVANLVDARNAAGQSEPVVHLSYMMTRKAVAGLPEMVRKAHEIGVDRLVAPNLDCPVTRDEEEGRIFGFGEPEKDIQKVLDEARIFANKKKFRLSVYPLKLSDEILVCELNPLTQFFVNVHGDVAPCPYASFMGRTPYDRYFLGETVPTEPLVFGSLAEASMETIWQSEAYRKFRVQYWNRRTAYDNLSKNRTSIHSVFGLQDYIREIDGVLTKYPVPPFCRKCYKAFGA